ncbi:MAG: serine/threonine protein kinase, partial [Myxococcales bacterium]|nr:serine/threonine protein kinase [Myxococcales bacterium]
MSEYAASRLGETLDRYRLEAVLGEGGFGAVYRARHVMMDRAVALKLLHPRMAHQEVQERFVREARTLARLGHPHIVGIHDCGVAATGEIFLAMELLEGEDLAGVLERRGALPPAEAVGLIVPVLEALEAAHAAGVVHRDLKPANVFLARVRGETVPKLLDFGISKVEGAGAERKLTRTGSVMGTPHYMAPETLRGAGEVDHRADLYAVGVMLYELIAGRTPHEAESYEALVVRIATDPVPPLGTVAPAAAPALAAAVDRALAREPGARFGSAAEMAAALRAAVGAGGEMAHAATAASGDWQPVAAEGRRGTGRRGTGRRGTGPLTDPRDGMPSTAVATPSSWRPPTPPPGAGPVAPSPVAPSPVAPSPIASTTPLKRRGRGPVVAMAL